jgi:molecular chaperone GrpE
MELVRKVLPAMDDLARVAAIPNENTTVEALDEGIELILRNLTKELGELGLERIEAVGERFDPELHQGMMVSPTSDADLDDTVSRVFVDGYQLVGRLVRPAQVEVLNFDPEGAEDA